MKKIFLIFIFLLIFLSVNVSAQVNFGMEVNNNGVTNYVTNDGLHSAIIGNEDIIWIKVNFNGIYTWIGLNNSKGVFEEGFRFWIKYITDENNNYNDYEENLDGSHNEIENSNKYSIKVGVLNKNRNDIVGQNTEIFVQVFDDAKLNDIYAMFRNNDSDENNFDMVALDCPSGRYNFAKIVLNSLDEFPSINNNQEKTYKIILDANGGKFEDRDIYIVEDITKFDYTKFSNPTRTGYKFIGFFTEKSDGKSFEEIMNSEAGVEEDMTFYARWEKEIENPKTFDGIKKNIFMLILSLIGLIGTILYVNKENKVKE